MSAVELTKAPTTTETIKIPTLLIGIPTVKRNGEEYLSDTLSYLLEDLNGFKEKFSQSLQINVLLYAGGMFYKNILRNFLQARMMTMQTS